MRDYIIKNLHSRFYSKFLLCLTFESIITYLDKIENDPEIISQSGELLIDQLLVTGNGYNRFVKCSFSNGEIDLVSAKNVIPAIEYRQLSVKLLQENYEYVYNSILTEEQRKMILNGEVI